MAAEVILTIEAEQDLAEAYAWYEQQRVGLGEEFMAVVGECIRIVSTAPEAFERVRLDYRRALVQRFPYAVFYEFAHDTVGVYAVFHTARNPKKWRKRLS
jgi:plasmid stabilization system protein ParE